MANRGFENPCELIVKDHEGLVYLAVKTVSAESMSSGKKMEGRVNKMPVSYTHLDAGLEALEIGLLCSCRKWGQRAVQNPWDFGESCL